MRWITNIGIPLESNRKQAENDEEKSTTDISIENQGTQKWVSKLEPRIKHREEARKTDCPKIDKH